jgi:hypothetical protein
LKMNSRIQYKKHQSICRKAGAFFVCINMLISQW